MIVGIIINLTSSFINNIQFGSMHSMQETVLDVVGDKKKSVKQSLSLSIKAETEQSKTCAHMKR